MLKKAGKFFIGLGILFGYYILGMCILKFVHIMIPPAILGLLLFALSLSFGIIKDEWVSVTCEFFLKNMAILFIPFLGGLIVYQSLLMDHWAEILIIIFVTTTLVIICTGLFVEYGIKWVKNIPSLVGEGGRSPDGVLSGWGDRGKGVDNVND